MSPDDSLVVELPGDFLAGSVAQLLDCVFPADEEGRRLISERFDLRANPDLPDIYAVFLAACDEWRDWRCALSVSAGREPVALDAPAAGLLRPAEDAPALQLRLEQEYRALDYAVRHGFWASRGELLGWMRAMVALYFLDKHEVTLAAPPPLSGGPALAQALHDLETQGLIAAAPPPENLPLPSGEGWGEGVAGDAAYAITAEGRRFIASLLTETESYIDQYDHYQDTLADAEGHAVEFGAGRGVDLRVETFLAEGLEPVRTVFLLRLYDGTLDSRLRDWTEAIETEALFEGLLEPVVNRHSAPPETLAAIIEQGQDWLDAQREQARREQDDRNLLRQARHPPPPEFLNSPDSGKFPDHPEIAEGFETQKYDDFS